ncbi:hypothetical protein DXG01_003143 [Tephrocybe rancida]|nr:hypothetical protein DXG01_003143 [Tephrocybe rancida]
MPEFSFGLALVQQEPLSSERPLVAVITVDPLQLWIIQLAIIVSTASLLSLALRRIRQPKVIAEVLAGILLGPTVFGRIPGFTETIFTQESRPYLLLTADIGLCLFLFLVGLEIDGSIIKKNVRLSATVALAGMLFPFIVGAGISALLYRQFTGDIIQITYFMFFGGVAFSVTAFPVLCRILTELKLLDTTVGVSVLSAGVANDIVGWVFLAVSIAILKAGSGATAMYVILGCAGWTLFLLFPVKYGLKILAVKSGSSAFVTGLIVPREGNLAIALTEKLEDMVQIIFLPLYFALLGMSTDFGLLNDGVTWAYTIAIILSAFLSKFGSCALAARYAAGLSWRESGAIGSLMSCKGCVCSYADTSIAHSTTNSLVELIVLHLGLSAGVFTPRVFTMFVLEALVLTFITTPLVVHFYPPHLRSHTYGVALSDGTIDKTSSESSSQACCVTSKRRFTVVLDTLEHIPCLMEFSKLIGPPTLPQSHDLSSSTLTQKHAPPSIQALRLIELSDRPSSVMKSSHMADTLRDTDPILAVFKMFGQLHALSVTPAIDVTTYDSYADSVAEHAHAYGADVILLPWLIEAPNSPTAVDSNIPPPRGTAAGKAPPSSVLPNPSTANHARFLQGVMKLATTSVAVFVDCNVDNMAQANGGAPHIFFPFFGGPDDRLALEYVTHFCRNEKATATVIRMIEKDLRENDSGLVSPAEPRGKGGRAWVPGFPDTLDERRLQSKADDDTVWEQCTSFSSDGLSAVDFRECITTLPLHASLQEVEISKRSNARLLIVVGRSQDSEDSETSARELKDVMEEYGTVGAEVVKTIGSVGTAFVLAGSGAGLIVFQSARNARD